MPTLAAQPCPFFLRSCQAGHYPLPDHGPLKFGENSHHLVHGAAGGRGRIKALLMQVEVDTLGMKLAE